MGGRPRRRPGRSSPPRPSRGQEVLSAVDFPPHRLLPFPNSLVKQPAIFFPSLPLGGRGSADPRACKILPLTLEPRAGEGQKIVSSPTSVLPLGAYISALTPGSFAISSIIVR